MNLTKQISLWMICVLLAANLLPLPDTHRVYAEDELTTILASDFEDGTLQGWAPKGSETITVSDHAAHGGTQSLRVSGRTEDWQGPNYVLTDYLSAERTYRISVWVKLDEVTPPSDVKLTMKSTIAGQDHWELIGTAGQEAASEWTLISGTYTAGSADGYYELYAEAVAGTSFYFDDAFVAMEAAPSGTGSGDGVTTGFEDGTLQSWLPRIGHETLTVSEAEARTGAYSMLVEGRSRTFHGPMLPLKDQLQKNKEYELRAYVRLTEEPAEDVTLQMTAYKKSGSESWNPLDTVTITKSEWQQWYELEGQLQYSDSPTELNLFIETPYITEDTIDTLSFYVDDVTVVPATELSIQEDIVSLKDYFENDFPIGAAVYRWQMEGAYGELLKKHFNSITATYEMKPKFISPAENEYDFAAADEYVQFAEDNGMGLRGHALLWHIDSAEWMFTDGEGEPASRELLLERLQAYIETVMTRYKGKIYAWDVVNEAIADNGGDEDGVRISPWYTLIGPDYIEKAFEFARAADPDAKLYYNDYFTEVPEKREHIYQLLKRLKQKGLIDGVGMQSHYELNSPSIEETEKSIKLFSSLGIDIQITELDVSSGINYGEDMPDDIAAKHAHRYSELMELYKSYKDHISSVTLWGLQDEKSYNKQALLFDGELQAKPAYWGLVDASSLPVLMNSAVSLKGSPAVTKRGTSDALWQQAVLTKLKQGGGIAGSFRTLWDEDNLYVQVEVADTTRDAADKVELFLDENNGKTTIYEQDDRHISLSRLQSNSADGVYTVEEQAAGYVLEAAVPWNTLTSEDGSAIGFDIRVKDASSSVSYWNDRTLLQHTDTSKYGVLSFAAMPKAAMSVKGSVVIDGIMDKAWNKTTPFSIASVDGNSAAGQARLMWTEDSLILLVDVTDPQLKADDPQPWLQDSVEIFMDENHQRTSFYQSDDAQYRININNEGSYAGNASASRLESEVVRTETGYRVEAKIKLASVQLNAKAVIGLDIQINDDQGEGNHGTAKWNDQTNESWHNTSQFGIVTFAQSHAGNNSEPGTSNSDVEEVEDDKGIMVVKEESLRNVSGGKVDITVQPETKQVILPIHAAQLLNDNQLAFTIGSVKLTFDAIVLQSVANQLTLEEQTGASLSIRMIPNDEAIGEQPINGEQGVAAKFVGQRSWSFELSILKDNGDEIHAGDFNGAVELAFSYTGEPDVSQQLLGIYTWDAVLGKWLYAGGELQQQTETVTVILPHFSRYALVEYDKSFSDVAESHWVNNELKALSAKQLVQGRSAAIFDPDTAVTRAEFAALLTRLIGIGEHSGDYRFVDVDNNKWYASAVHSAYHAGIIKGRSASQFAPNQSMTREELAVMLANAYAFKNGAAAAAPIQALSYADSESISDWAMDSVAAVTSLKLMQGQPNQLFIPHATTTRAEAVQALYHLMIILQ